MTIDLRSDTVTRPTSAMLTAMMTAETGDDVYGDDPTVGELESRVAGMLGHESGLFTVSGSLANLLGVRAWVGPGQEVLCDDRAHIVRAEMGAHAALTGVTTRTWSDPDGLVDVEAVARMAVPDAGPFIVPTAAVEVENTHNFAGGTIQPLDRLDALREILAPAGVRMHLDGARLWNAHVETGVALDRYGALFDTVSVCLSKGLGAPVGSVLVGPHDVIAEARVWRKRLGGGWRQAGVLAAAGLYALDHHMDRLVEDHQNARLIASTIADAVGTGVVDPVKVATNVILLNVGSHAAEAVSRVGDAGVRCGVVAPGVVRLITHLDVSPAEARAAASTLVDVLRAIPAFAP